MMLSPQNMVDEIINEYSNGYFLMDEAGELRWYTSKVRAIIPLNDEFHISKSMKRVLRKDWSFKINQNFMAVINGCRNREETWISNDLVKVYLLLHKTGWAHSYESYYKGELAGGVLGISIQSAFIGESMSHSITNGSKAALIMLQHYLRNKNFMLFDAQIDNPHLQTFGSKQVTSLQYKKLLQTAINKPNSFL